MRLHQFAGLIAGFSLLALAGCASVPTGGGGGSGLPEQPIDAPPPPPPSETTVVEEPAPPPPPPPPPPEMLVSGLAWEMNHSERAPWSTELRTQVRANLASFDKATDWADFCPTYGSLTADDKVEVIATLAVAIARYESNYNPHTIYHEPAPLNVDSVGLFQLPYEDGFTWCTLNRTAKSLEDPINNIRCAVPKMARLIAKDKVVTAGSTGANAQGLARYWSTVRLGPTHKLAEIRNATRGLSICRA
ncbi:lytic transglycosylase, catalytic [Asticcacaulis biprosthecium C19]|uniref:Lytic transglycosylase, catalytic n=1 Tax=Asticcacaulis biprosthecium C19 TaxID=715226 RepID=F4QSN1_9CAUL|nr:transglycosylase SLT domain-containing protein [Asticcacaulis biprosthecium]EGF89751.1 lytic transglycosylase, catalytic [Asticcacaulis biprosthecium C19]